MKEREGKQRGDTGRSHTIHCYPLLRMALEADMLNKLLDFELRIFIYHRFTASFDLI